MAKTISSLNVILGATVAPLVSAFKTAESATFSLFGAIESLADPIAGVSAAVAGLGGIVGGLGIGALVKDQAEAIGTTTLLADRMDLSTESLVGFQHAAELAHISSEQLQGGLEKMLKNIGEAQMKGGDAAAAFQSLGLNLSTIATENPADAFTQIAQAISQVENPAARAYEAVQIFGKSGQELLPMMSQGAAGIKAASDEAKLLGLSFNSVDGAKVESALQSVTRVEDVFMGIGRQIAIAIEPALKASADLFTHWGETAVGLVQEYLPGIVNVAGAVFNKLESVVVTAWNAIYGYTAPIVTSIVDWIGKNWRTIVDGAIDVFSAVATEVYSGLTGVWAVVTTIGGAIFDTWEWAMNGLGLGTEKGTTDATSHLSTFARVFNSIADDISLAYNSLAFGISHFGQILDYTLTTAAAGWVTFYNEIGYGVTDVIGGYLEWLGSNWLNVFTTMGSFVGSVFTNMATNAANFFEGLWSWMKGDGFNFKWTGLTEGFKATLTDLPTIADRQMGPIEKSLHDQSDRMGTDLAIGYSDFLRSQADKSHAVANTIKDAFSNTGDWIKDAFKNGFFPKTIPAPKLKDNKPFDVDTSGAEKKVKELKEHTETLNAVLAGSAESMQLHFQAIADESMVNSEAAARLSETTAAPLPSATYSDISGNGNGGNAADPNLQMIAVLNLIYQAVTTGTNGVPVHIIQDDTAPEAVSI